MASLDLCVYGTPLGFDSYEAPPAMGEYYEQFYRTNRRGRMLMANRRNDGSTIYSFLVYDLIETRLRQHAFFGTSFTIRGNQYIPDLHSLYALFNTIFDNYLTNGQLFVAASGKLRYTVGKFNTVEEILSGYLAKIMSGLASFETEYYTSDFQSNNSGQIALKNIDTPVRILTDTFKRCQWLAVSPNFKPDDPGIDIDLGDINQQYTMSLESLMQMSIHKHLSDIDKIKVIISSTDASVQLLKKYAAQGNIDNDELQKINDLSSKLNTLRANASALKSQLEQTVPEPPEPPTKKLCPKCRREKPLSAFDKDSEICRECAPVPSRKLCTKCGREKPLSAFDKDSEICRECAYVPFWKKLDPPMVAITAIILVIGFVSWILISSEKEPQPNPGPIPPTDTSTVVDNTSNFAEALAVGNLDEALLHITETDFDSNEEIRKRFEKDAQEIILTSNGNAVSNLQFYLARYPNVSEKFGGVTESLKFTAKDLDDIYSQLNAAKLSTKTKEVLKNKISKHEVLSDSIKNILLSRVNNIPSPQEGRKDERIPPAPQPTSTIIELYEVESDYITVIKNRGKIDIATQKTIELDLKKYYIIQYPKDLNLEFTRPLRYTYSPDRSNGRIQIHRNSTFGVFAVKIGNSEVTIKVK